MNRNKCFLNPFYLFESPCSRVFYIKYYCAFAKFTKIMIYNLFVIYLVFMSVLYKILILGKTGVHIIIVIKH
jgi:hypothetical protein